MEREFEEVELVKRKKKKEEKKKRSVFAILFSKRKNSRISLLLIALLVTGVLLSGSTYAWFTANYNVSVTTIDVTVAASQGIQVSTNAVEWKPSVTTAELVGTDVDATGMTAYAGNTNQIPSSTVQLSPVSTVRTITADRLTMYTGAIETANIGGVDQFILTAEALAAPTGVDGGGDSTRLVGSYIVFDLFIRSDFATSKQLYLNGTAGIIAGATNTGIQNATRVGILLLGNTSVASTSADMVDLAGGDGLLATQTYDYTGNTGAGNEVTEFAADETQLYIWEPNYEMHVPTGYNNATGRYGHSTSLFTAGGTNTYYTTEDPLPYSGVKATIETGDHVLLGQATAANYSTQFDAIVPNYATTTDNATDVGIFNLQPGVTKMRIYMWIEGQDVDCEDGESGGNIRFNLQFKVQQ